MEVVSEQVIRPKSQDQSPDDTLTHSFNLNSPRQWAKQKWASVQRSLQRTSQSTPSSPATSTIFPTTTSFKSLNRLCLSKRMPAKDLDLLLRSSPQLKFLLFENPVVLGDTDAEQVRKEPLCLKLLKYLWIHNTTHPLGSSEYFLVRYFTHVLEAPELKSFHFRADDDKITLGISRSRKLSARLASALGECELDKCYDDQDNEVIVAKFLVKHRQSLHDLSLGGEGFKMNPLMFDEGLLQELAQVKLNHILFSMDTQGMEVILENQKNTLKTLIVKGATNLENVNPLIFALIQLCVEQNSESLTDFMWYLYGCIPRDSEQLPSGLLPDSGLMFDGNLFKICHHLQSLTIAVVLYNLGQKERIGGRFLNIYDLPRSLQEISISCAEFYQDAFDLLGCFIAQFTQLQTFYFCSVNRTNKYKVKMEWILGFQSLLNFKSAEFVNADVSREHMQVLKALILIPKNTNATNITLNEEAGSNSTLHFVRQDRVSGNKDIVTDK